MATRADHRRGGIRAYDRVRRPLQRRRPPALRRCRCNTRASKPPALRSEYRALPEGSMISQADGYRVERAALRALHKLPPPAPCPRPAS